MSTRSLIGIQRDKDKFECIYCHSDGYLSYNGAMLLDHYSDKEKVEKLLKLGSISLLERKIEPNPDQEHSFCFNKRQEDVVVAYTRDRGDEMEPSVMLTLDKMSDYGWIEYSYFLDLDNKWKYIKNPDKTIRDVKEDLDKEYKSLKIKRPKDFYGFWTDEALKKERKRQQEEEM
jgi:hypothetical protein